MTKFVSAQAIPTSIPKFASMCKDLDSNAIYDLFECSISQELRDDILSEADINVNEPVRAAFNIIGKQFNIQSLIDY